MRHLAILISGRGSNMRALAEACAAPGFPAEPVVVIADGPEAVGLEIARNLGIDTAVVDRRAHYRRDSFDAALNAEIAARGADLVCLAGFMRLLGRTFVAHWRDRLVNVHPSLLPDFKGLNTHARVLAFEAWKERLRDQVGMHAWELAYFAEVDGLAEKLEIYAWAVAAGIRQTGCTVHFVRPAMDVGPIIVQAAVPVHDGDDAESLARRVLAEEHRIYPLAVRWIAEDRVRITDETVFVDRSFIDRSATLEAAYEAALMS